MIITIKIDPNDVREKLDKIRDFKENFLQWAVENESPAQYPEDFLLHLKTLNEVDKYLLNICHLSEEENECSSQIQVIKN